MPNSSRQENWFYIGVIAAIILGLYLSSLYNYLFFHSLVEIFTIVIGFTLFILTWNARKYLANDCLKILGIGYGFIALIDLLHTFAYKGMNVFPGFDANLPTQLWITARFMQAATLCLAPIFIRRKISEPVLLAGFLMVVLVIVAMVFSSHFPDCFVEGKGLTVFKIASEYVITVILFISLLFFYKVRAGFREGVYVLIVASVACTVVSEISFTAYLSVYGFANMFGHILKLAAFYLIYRALLVTGFKEPFNLIFRDLKQAEEALRKTYDTLEEQVKERTAQLCASEEKYRSLIRKVQTAIVLHDSQGRIMDSNPLAHHLLCLSEDQLLGKALIDPEWHFLREDGSVLPVAEYPVSLVLSTQKPLRGYVTGICRPGQNDVTWVLVNAEPEYNDTREIARVLVSFVDITGLKRTERQLTLVDFALNHVREAAFLIDENACLQYVNDEACRILGYTRTELLGLSVQEIDPDFPLERWSNHWNDLKMQRSLTFEGRHRAKDGRIFPVEVNANYFEHDGQGYNLALVRDITERKQAAETLETERKRMEIVLSAQNTGLSLINPDMTIAWVNPKIREMFPGREPVGQVCHVFYESRETICEGCGTLRAFKAGKIVESEQLVPATSRWYYIISQPIKDTAGHVVNVLEGITDITERKKGEEKLRQNLSELQRWHDVTLDREDRVQELKAEVNQLLTRQGEPPRYESQI